MQLCRDSPRDAWVIFVVRPERGCLDTGRRLHRFPLQCEVWSFMSRAYGQIDGAAKRRILKAAVARLKLTNKALAAREGVSPAAVQSVLWRARHKGER